MHKIVIELRRKYSVLELENSTQNNHLLKPLVYLIQYLLLHTFRQIIIKFIINEFIIF